MLPEGQNRAKSTFFAPFLDSGIYLRLNFQLGMSKQVSRNAPACCRLCEIKILSIRAPGPGETIRLTARDWTIIYLMYVLHDTLTRNFLHRKSIL